MAQSSMKRSLRSDRPRYPNGRPKPTSRTVATSSGVNRKFHQQGLKYSPEKASPSRPMRDLKQIPFAELCRWSERMREMVDKERAIWKKEWPLLLGVRRSNDQHI